MGEIELKERKPTWDYMLNDLAFSSLKTRVLYGIFDNQNRFDFEYQIELKDKEIERLNNELEEFKEENKIKKLQEENLLLRASEPMSKLVDDYGYKAKNEEAIKLIKKWRVNPTSYFENMRGSLIVPKVETDRLLKLLGDMENE